MTYRKRHDIWQGPIIEYYPYADRQQTCSACINYDNCRKERRGKSTCKAFAFANGKRLPNNSEKTESTKRPQRAQEAPLDWVASELRAANIAYIDKRPLSDRNGSRRPSSTRPGNDCLWIVGKRTKFKEEVMHDLEMQGAVFGFSSDGCSATANRPGWFLKGFPVRKDNPLVSNSGKRKPKWPKPLRIFHDEYGYGDIVSRSGPIATVRFVDGIAREMSLEYAFRMGKARANKQSKKGVLEADGMPSVHVGDFIVHTEHGIGLITEVGVDRFGKTFATAQVGDGERSAYLRPVYAEDLIEGIVRLRGPRDRLPKMRAE